jgi:hypothetical protein
MRARAGVEGLATGRWSGGSVAVRVEEGTDGWGIPVSVLQREGSGQVQRAGQLGPCPGRPICGPLWAGSKQADSEAVLFFFFLLCRFCVIFEIV